MSAETQRSSLDFSAAPLITIANRRRYIRTDGYYCGQPLPRGNRYRIGRAADREAGAARSASGRPTNGDTSARQAGRPESNRIAERCVRTLKEWLLYYAWQSDDELKALPCQFCRTYNDRPHQGISTPGLSPNEFAARFWLF